MEVQWTSGCSEPAAAATKRRQRPSGGSDPAAATIKRWGNGGAANQRLAANQRRQRPSGGNEPANQRRWRGRLQGERREKWRLRRGRRKRKKGLARLQGERREKWSCLEKWRLRRGRRKRKKGTHFGTGCQSPEAKWKCIGPGSSPPEAKSLL